MNKNTYFYIWTLCLLVVTGCQRKSGNIWEENQTTGARYSKDSVSALWEKGEYSMKGAEENLLPFDEADIKNQFVLDSLPQSSRELGKDGLPSVDQFQSPRGNLASIFTPLFFNTDEHVFKNKEYLKAIRHMANYLRSHQKTYVIIEGHCDERGPEAYNLALGTRRANYVRSLLIKEGVKPDQIHTVSLGKEHPFALEHTQSAWAKNRRTHFRIHSSGE